MGKICAGLLASKAVPARSRWLFLPRDPHGAFGAVAGMVLACGSSSAALVPTLRAGQTPDCGAGELGWRLEAPGQLLLSWFWHPCLLQAAMEEVGGGVWGTL